MVGRILAIAGIKEEAVGGFSKKLMDAPYIMG